MIGDWEIDRYDAATLDAALDGLRRTHDQKLATYRELSRKAERTVYAGIALTGAAVGAPSIAGTPVARTPYLLGFLAVGAAIAVALAGYATREISQGISPEMIDWLTAENPSAAEWKLRMLTRTYYDAVTEMDAVNGRKARLVTGAQAALVLAVACFVTSFILAS